MTRGIIRHSYHLTRRAFARQESTLKMIFRAAAIGLSAGALSVLFLILLDAVTVFFLNRLAGVTSPAPLGEPSFFALIDHPKVFWLIVLLPAFGGLCSGLLTTFWAPEAEGHGTDAMIKAYHQGGGEMRLRVPFIKALATLFVLGTGGSAGREGPIIQIGAGIGAAFGKFFHLSPRARRHLFLAGAAGALGAVFRAPLGGAITATEILYREDFESEAFIPCIISSVTGYALFTHFFGHGTIFRTEGILSFGDAGELPIYALLGVACALAGKLFILVFKNVQRFSASMAMPKWLKPAVGGLLVGLIGLGLPEATGTGWGFLQEGLLGRLAVSTMLLIALMKILTCSLTVGTGGSGGLFGPALFIGGMLGGAFGHFFHSWWPETVVSPASYVLVGMASFFAGIANAPLGSLVMVAELSGSYRLIVPLMLVCVMALLFSRRWGVYESQVATKFDSPVHRRRRILDVLSEFPVRDARSRRIEPGRIVSASMPIATLVLRMESGDDDFFAVGAPGRIVGIIEADDLMNAVAGGIPEGIVAADVMSRTTVLHAEDSLRTALALLASTDTSHLLIEEIADGKTTYRVVEDQDLEEAYLKLSIDENEDEEE